MSNKFEIRRELEYIKWILKNPLVSTEDKMTPIYEAVERIEKEVNKL